MIEHIRGLIFEKKPPQQIILETNGLGYEIHMPITSFSNLPEIGKELVILTHFVLRQDTQILFGFINNEDRILFRELIKINGVGPQLSMIILSYMSVQQFITCLEKKKINALIKIPGVGKKIAERILVEMKDRLKIIYNLFINNSKFTPKIYKEKKIISNSENQAIAGLVALGYKQQEASNMVSKIAYAGADCESLIRYALRTVLGGK